MGRYAYENNINYEYKFGLGSQSSNLGEVLEDIFYDVDNVYIDRYTGNYGEIVKVNIDDSIQFMELLEGYLGDFTEPSDYQWSLWSRMDKSTDIDENTFNMLMIKQLLDCYKNNEIDKLEFDIEY